MAAPIKLKPATFDPVAKMQDLFRPPITDALAATLGRIRTPSQRMALWLAMTEALISGTATAEDQAALGFLMWFMNQEHLLLLHGPAPKPDYSLVVEMAQSIKWYGERMASDAAAMNIVKDVPFVQEIVNEFADDLLRKINSGLIEKGFAPLSADVSQSNPEPRDLEQMDPRVTRAALERFQLKRQRGRPKKK